MPMFDGSKWTNTLGCDFVDGQQVHRSTEADVPQENLRNEDIGAENLELAIINADKFAPHDAKSDMHLEEQHTSGSCFPLNAIMWGISSGLSGILALSCQPVNTQAFLIGVSSPKFRGPCAGRTSWM
ncbi:hypothetical protein FA15DRAFT_659697 [Coprinopsis marcescibilis]|uniref:Uncharacterized protein n=1 Tax=Coprinopsis marcescibilis TaxID=230819 RepID=A0A5C3KHR6_COPMA|nr:hypothetical protein FA15DRAFT_659697 [Coprinopsis marcescibilis]